MSRMASLAPSKPIRWHCVAVFTIALQALPANVAHLNAITPAHAEQAKLSKEQAAASAAYDKALAAFKKILAERRAQIDGPKGPAKKLPRLPGQAVYLARLKVMSTYKDLTEAWPERIGRPNKFGVPPDHFDADIEPLIDEYAALFRVMQAPPAFAQASETPRRDVVELGTAIARAKGADKAAADMAGRIALGIFFAETNARQNIGNARSDTYKGSLQTGKSEDRNGHRKWVAIKKKVAALDPKLAARDTAETARAANIDQRYNHWTAVRNGLMNAHADLFSDLPEIAKMLPDEIDQMKLFQLIQIVPTTTRAALKSGNVEAYRISDARVMGFLRNNSIFTFGKANRARNSATYREILDAMWLFTPKFEKARASFNAIKQGAAE
jgi:hypothetical protein